MRSVTIRILAAVLAAVALGGCEPAGAPPGAPGSMTVYLHGRTQVDIGASSH